MIPAHIGQHQGEYTPINTHEYMVYHTRSFVNKGKHYFSFFRLRLRHTSLPWYSSNWPDTFGFVLGFTKIMDSKIPKSPKKSIKALHFKESNKWKDVVQNLEKYIEICFPQPTSATRTTPIFTPEKVSKKSKGHFTVHVICSDCHCTVHTICSDCHFTVHTICSDCHCK